MEIRLGLFGVKKMTPEREKEIREWARDQIDSYLNIQDETPPYGAEFCQDLLNEFDDLREENDRLKKENEGAKACAMSWALDCKELRDELERKKKELQTVYKYNLECMARVDEYARLYKTAMRSPQEELDHQADMKNFGNRCDETKDQ
jgi:hypothetical protein